MAGPKTAPVWYDTIITDVIRGDDIDSHSLPSATLWPNDTTDSLKKTDPMIVLQETALPDVKLITPRVFSDSRGSVSETHSERRLAEVGLTQHFVQENQSYSAKKGTVRGLHFQKNPFAQAKLIRVIKGSIFDVAVDVRPGSPTYGKHVDISLSEDNPAQLYIPAGFAHGFCTLTDDAIVLYKVDSFYAPESEGGILWNDPDLRIAWPVDPAEAILSEKDLVLPRFKDLPRMEW